MSDLNSLVTDDRWKAAEDILIEHMNRFLDVTSIPKSTPEVMGQITLARQEAVGIIESWLSEVYGVSNPIDFSEQFKNRQDFVRRYNQ